MANPTIEELFGAGASTTVNGDGLFIPAATFTAEGITIATANSVEAFACVVKKVHSVIEPNTDETILMTSRLNVSTPSLRNNVETTNFDYGFEFFGAYTEPTLDPNDL